MDFNKLTIKSQEAVAAAQELARRNGNPELYPEHLLLALLDQELPRQLVPDADTLRAEAEARLAQKPRIRGGQRVTSPDPEGTYQALSKFGRDLTELAEQGKLDPVIGRDEEIRRVIQVLSRRTKNNPVLIGDPGVGKTALDEYRKHVERDAALERRFQPIFLGEPSVADTIAILRGLKERYEAHHGVRIRDAALVAAAVLSDRYISDRFLPDKAIDLVDEAASRVRTEIDSQPLELDEAERRVRQLEIELAAMAKESKEVREPLERELAEARSVRDELAARWAKEKEVLDRVKEITQRIDDLRMEAERAERQGDLQRVAEIRYGELPALERELAEREEAEFEPMVKEEVDEDDVAAVVARWTGIPVDKLLEGETEKLIHMEERLHERVVGQDED